MTAAWVVRDAPERLVQYEQLIAALDVEPQSLEIEATIIEVQLNDQYQQGINWSSLRTSATAGPNVCSYSKRDCPVIL